MRCLVIGGTKGIGRAVAERLRESGQLVLVAARGSDDDLLAVRPDLTLDLAWPAAGIKAAVRRAIGRMGGIDWMVLSAGTSAYRKFYDWKDIERNFQVNIFGRIQAYAAALPHLTQSKGKALFIGSTVAKYGAKGLSTYAGSMAANEGFVRSEALKAKGGDVQVNVLAPGWTNSEMTAELREDYREAAERWMPIGRFLEPHEVAAKAERVLLEDHFGEVIEYLGEDLL